MSEFLCRIEFDEEVQGKLNNTMNHMKERLLRKSQRTWRHIDEDLYGGLNWMVDFGPDSVVNMKLRKKDVTNYALNNEGNIYNSLINKVCTYSTITLLIPGTFQ